LSSVREKSHARHVLTSRQNASTIPPRIVAATPIFKRDLLICLPTSYNSIQSRS
jgi:hypothetical protein